MSHLAPHKFGYVILDTETGGLNERVNPLLSVAAVLLDTQHQYIDGFSLKVKPPENCYLMVPVRSSMFSEGFKTNDAFALHLATGQTIDPGVARRSEGACIIDAKAAEINGFVTAAPDGSWDMESPYRWISEGLTTDGITSTLLTLFRQAFQVKPYGVAHNAQFDAKFVATWLPDVAREINNPWFCTLRWLQDYLPTIGISPRQKGVAKLDNLCKYAGYDLANAHEAFADAQGCAAGLRWLSRAHPLTDALLPKIIVPCNP